MRGPFFALWHAVRQRTAWWAGGLALALAAGGCDYTITKQYTGEYKELEGRTIVIYFAVDEEELHAACDKVVPTSFFKAGCVGIATNDDERRRMMQNMAAEARRVGSGVDCVLIVPASRGILEHELGLCASKAEGYPHKVIRTENQ